MKKYQSGGLMDSEGKPVRDSSGQPVMTGSGRDEDDTEARMESARNKLSSEVQDMVKAKKATSSASSSNDGDMDERDRRMEAAASAPSRMPSRPGQSAPKASKPVVAKAPAKAKPAAAVVSRARATPAGSAPKQTTSGPYRSEGRNRPASAAPEKRPGAALPISSGVLKQREADEKRREGRREQGRIRDSQRESEFGKFSAAVKNDPKQKELKSAQEKKERMSPAERSAARGKAVKEFFGMAKGGSTSSASKRADGIATKGKTRGKVY